MFETPKYLGSLPRLATGVRLPEVLLNGIFNALKKSNSVATLMLSFGRETAPKYVINAPPGKYDITMGHAGISIQDFINLSTEAAREKQVIIEIEADHLMIRASPPIETILRLYEDTKNYRENIIIEEKELEKSISYAKDMVDEAIATSYIHSFTIDVIDLINQCVDNWSSEKIEKEFNKVFNDHEKKRLYNEYLKKSFNLNGKIYEMSRLNLMTFALKHYNSLPIFKRMYDYIKNKMGDKPFGIEMALDETKRETDPLELFYVLKEIKSLGCHIDFVAPNIGFKKRLDFDEDLKILGKRIKELSIISKILNSNLSFHSGSGSNPYTGKGPGVYETILKNINGSLKYKVSGVYLELILSILHSFPEGSPERKLYEQIFDEVYDFLIKYVEENPHFKTLKKLLEKYEENVHKGLIKKRDPRTTFFRFYSLLALNMRDNFGKRYFREKIIELYESNENFRSYVDKEVEKITLNMINGLKLVNNIKYLRLPT
jgi:hypothetical protein